MEFREFQSMVSRLARAIPSSYLEGVAAIEVSPKTVPHPVGRHVYTLGECVPLDLGPEGHSSRLVLYYGSFRALAHQRPEFDWRGEAWETLLHELRHDLEWRAQTRSLDEYDWAAEQNFARAEGRPFDPLFYQAAEHVGEGIYRIDDDVFLERVVRRLPASAVVPWRGRQYRVPVPRVPLPLYLALDGLHTAPSGDVIVVFRRRPRIWDLVRRSAPVTTRRARAVPIQ